MLESSRRRLHGFVGLVLGALLLTGCATETADMTLELTSPAFDDGGLIPSRHTCDGHDISPPLQWSSPPDGPAELALVMDDPDAGGFVHWVVVGIPAAVNGLDEGGLPPGSRVGRNDFGGVGYRGPCPPSGTHRYVFTVFALSQPLVVSAAPTAAEIRAAAAGSTVAEATLTGNYARR